MKKVLKWVGILLLVVLVAIAVLLTYVKTALPNVGPPPEIIASKSPAEVIRGEYLANHVMACMDCHSKRLGEFFSMPPDTSTLGQGGGVFDKKVGFPGTFYAANITPAGIGNWTDGEIYRAISTGVRKNGKPIFPVMPYTYYRHAAPADIMAVIAYVRSLSPKTNQVAESHADFPMNFILNTIPQRPEPYPVPDPADSLGQGKYLSMISACVECHTPFAKGSIVAGQEFSGGREFILPTGTVRSANITQDKVTGIGSWTRELFIQRFSQYRDSAAAHRRLAPGEMQSVMPWTMYAGMTDRDLSNIYTYLKTVQPISHNVRHYDAVK